MTTIVRIPKGSANDDVMRLICFSVADGSFVPKGATVAEVEGEKAVIEIDAPVAGYFYYGADVEAELQVGFPVGLISPKEINPEDARKTLSAEQGDGGQPATAEHANTSSVSSKAAALMAEHGLTPENFPGAGLITAKLVTSHLANKQSPPPQQATEGLRPPREIKNCRVLLCGGGPGAAQVRSILMDQQETEIVGLLDDDENKQGKEIFGMPVVGTCDGLADAANRLNADSVICTTPSSIAFRRKIDALANAAGLRLANAVHPTAHFDDGVLVGRGNVFGAFSFIGADSIIGHGGFFSSRTTIEHHNRIGDFVTTGPCVATSGMVTIGSDVRFGTGIFIEPGVTIGDRVIVASGSVLMTDVASGKTVKYKS